MSRPQKCLVLGIGNLLLSDEGVGIHVLRGLQQLDWPEGIEMLDGGTGGFQLLGCFRDYDTIVIINASLNGNAPGTVTVTQPRFASDFPRVLSSHDIGLRDLIESATLLGDLPRMFLVAISIVAGQPMGTELSTAARAAIDNAVEQVQTILQRTGFLDGPAASDLIDSDGDDNA